MWCCSAPGGLARSNHHAQEPLPPPNLSVPPSSTATFRRLRQLVVPADLLGEAILQVLHHHSLDAPFAFHDTDLDEMLPHGLDWHREVPLSIHASFMISGSACCIISGSASCMISGFACCMVSGWHPNDLGLGLRVLHAHGSVCCMITGSCEGLRVLHDLARLQHPSTKNMLMMATITQIRMFMGCSMARTTEIIMSRGRVNASFTPLRVWRSLDCQPLGAFMATDDRDDDDYHDYGEYVFVDAGVFVRRFVCVCVRCCMCCMCLVPCCICLLILWRPGCSPHDDQLGWGA